MLKCGNLLIMAGSSRHTGGRLETHTDDRCQPALWRETHTDDQCQPALWRETGDAHR